MYFSCDLHSVFASFSTRAKNVFSKHAGDENRSILYSFVILFFMFAPLFAALAAARILDDAKEMQKRITECDYANVETITLKPTGYSSLVDEAVVINDPEQVRTLCLAFQNAKSYSPDHPVAKWRVIVDVSAGDDSVTFLLYRNIRDDGIYISMNSDVTSGFNYGSLRNDKLKQLLEAYSSEEY